MSQESFEQHFQIPGTEQVLSITRAASGQLLKLQGGGRVYIDQQEDGLHYDQDLAIISESLIGNTLLRTVKTAHSHWLERYIWGEDERLIEVDGTVFQRDEKQRIIASTAYNGDSWHYRYGAEGPVVITTPTGRRNLRWQEGKVTGLSENSRHQSFTYQDDIRHDTPEASGLWQRDELGCVWCIYAPDGSIQSLFLWDGFACLGRIDGHLGDPLTAVFSLDPTCTPVRIITADEVLRIPRDAFGESLLAYSGNPGLYGGMVWQGYIHLPSRVLDSRTGCFTTPDSYNGLDTDPRREAGFKGALLTEHNSINRYAISQYDGIGRADPTGNLSFWVYLSDFTWSLQNNLVGWFGLDWTINLFGSLFSGQIKDFFDFEHLESSERLGLTAVRRDGLMAPGRAWTFQHLVMLPKEDLHELAEARVIDPQKEFMPTLYGTVLYAKPSSGKTVLLRGTSFTNMTSWPNNINNTTLSGPINWTRSGGSAKAVIAGSSIPYFPNGGLHFNDLLQEIVTDDGIIRVNRGLSEIPEPCAISIKELEANSASVLGTIDASRDIINLNTSGTGLAVDHEVLLTDSTNNTGIFKILSANVANNSTRIRFNSALTAIGPANIRLRQLSTADVAETLVQTSQATHVELQGSTGNYQVTNALRLSQGGNVVDVRLIDKFEARIELDIALPDPFVQPITVFTATPTRALLSIQRSNNDSTLSYPDGLTLPSIGALLLVQGNTNSVAVKVTAINAREVVVDLSLVSTGANGDTVTVQSLSRNSITLGVRNEPREAAAQLTYTPENLRNAPSTGILWLEDNTGQIAVRITKSRIYDAMVLDQALAGNQANPYQVERFTVSGFDQDDLSITKEQVLILDEDIDLEGANALVLQEITRGTSGNIIIGTTDAAWTNNTASISKLFSVADSIPSLALPAEAIVISDGSNEEIHRIASTKVTIELDRSLLLTVGDDVDIKLVTLAALTSSQRYQARLVGPLHVKLVGHSLTINTNVSVIFNTNTSTPPAFPPNQIIDYRVSNINAGNTLSLVGGQLHSITVTPEGASALTGSITKELLVAALPFVGQQLVQMPRLKAEAIISLTWDSTSVNLKVVAIDGDIVTLARRDAPTGIHDLYIKEVSWQQLQAENPGHGSVWEGINGQIVNGVATATNIQETTQLSFDVWAANAIPRNALLAITLMGENISQSFPCRIASSSDINVEISLDKDLSSTATPLSVAAASIVQTGFSVDFIREERALILRDTPPLFAASATHTIFLTVMTPAEEEIRQATTAHIGPGTVLVPEDPEHAELDRRQSLIDHELIHTRQSATWGPLLLAWFPLFALEGLYEGLTDIEEADYSTYVSAELTTINNTRLISIPNASGVSFNTDDTIQIYANAQKQTVKLGGSPADNASKFAITLNNNIADQNLRVRKVLNDSGWETFRDVTFNIQQVLTHGGVLNTLTGSVYGGLFHLIGRLAYAATHSFGDGRGKRYASVIAADKISISLKNDTVSIAALQGSSRIIVQQGDASYVRPLSAPAAGNTLTLSSAIELTGDIFVAPYSTHTPDTLWDWHNYYPAQIPDPLEPAAIKVFAAAENDTLTLKPFDRVMLSSGGSSKDTNVIRVRDDGIVELEEIPKTSGEQRNFRIAKIDEGDPIGNVDSIALRELGFGWMRWLFDPYGQFQHRLQPDDNSFWGYTARISRYLFGSTSWSLMPILGYYFWDNLFVQIGDNGHFSQMEQEASEESGDLYSPIARLRGDFTLNSDTGHYQGVVGDIGRYWYFHTSRTATVIQESQYDAPNTHFTETTSSESLIRVMSNVVATGSATASPFPNANATSSGATAALALPDSLFYKTTPLSTTVVDPTSFAPSSSGYLPVTARLERCMGMYTSFSQAGSHRITVANGIPGAENAVNVQEGDHPVGIINFIDSINLIDLDRQTIYFNVDISDVTVTVAGQTVTAALSDASTAGIFLPETIELVQLQTARINVLPNAARRYAISIPHSGKGGYLLSNGTNEITALNRNTEQPDPITPSTMLADPEAVEISRLYTKNAEGKYTNAVLNAHNGLHLIDDLHIPVRSFLVNVINTLPIRKAVTLESSDILNPNEDAGKLHPGDSLYVIIPVDPVGTLELGTVDYPTKPTLVTNTLSLVFASESIPEALQAFVGDGVISKVTLPADNPPETTARITLTIQVGYQELRADLTAEMEVVPHMTLQLVTGLELKNDGSSLSFNAQDSDGAAANLAQDSIRLLETNDTPATGLSATVTNAAITITATSSASLGRKQVLVKKTGDNEHWAKLSFTVIA